MTVEPDRYVMVKTEAMPCVEPCDRCFILQCAKDAEDVHRDHECHVCAEVHGKVLEKATSATSNKRAVREELKWRKPESFHYVVDKTICLVKGFALGAFNKLTDEAKEKLRKLHDPKEESRKERQVESQREEYRVRFFERLSKQLMEGASRTFGLEQSPGSGSRVEPVVRPSFLPDQLERLRDKACIEPLRCKR